MAADRPGTVKSEGGVLRRLVAYLRTQHPAVRRWGDLRRAHLLDWLTSPSTSGRALAATTRRHYVWRLRRFFARAPFRTRRDRSCAALLTGRDVPKADVLLPRALSPDADRALLRVLRADPSRDAKALLLMRLTGVRLGELLKLERECLQDAGGGRWSVRVPIGKLHSERAVPADREIVDLIADLRRLAEGSTAPTGPARPPRTLLPGLAPWRARCALHRLAREAGIQERVWTHRLRHTYATDLLRRGMSFVGVMRVLGHSCPKMTLRYLSLTDEDVHREYLAARARPEISYRIRGAVEDPAAPELTDAAGIVAALGDIAAAACRMASDEPDAARRKRMRLAQRSLARIQKVFAGA